MRLPHSLRSFAMTENSVVIANPSHFLTDEAIAFDEGYLCHHRHSL
ncbi:hypothetical protein KAX35_05400 [candidate division WOR-3 bacterium]|nr:hypothetical protein [candidate division WOR-3 bacterium]